MKRIKLHDKEFELSIHHSQIQAATKWVAQKINEDLKNEPSPVFLCVLNGSFMFAADLLKQIKFHCEVSFVKLASYSGTASLGEVKELIGLTTNIKNRTVIIVEDIVDTGYTLRQLHNILQTHHPKQLKVATCLFKPEAYKETIPVDYTGLRAPSKFIVGYGLDYNGLGRNLQHIYSVIK